MTSWKQAAALCLTLCFVASLPVLAQEPPAANQAAPQTQGAPGKPALNIHVDPEISKNDALYGVEVKKLTPEQQAKLKELESDYYKTFELDMQVIKTSAEVKYCAKQQDSEIAKNFGKYKSEFGVYSNALQAQLREARMKHHARFATEAPFIDQKLIASHYAFITNLTVQMAVQMTQINLQQGGFAKTDCAKTGAMLDDAFKTASASPQAPAGAAEATADKLAQIQAGAAKGDPESMVVLGMLMVSGQGVAKDTTKGLELLTKTAEGGYARAQYMLGLALGTDALGLTPDKEKAKYWLGKAAAQGDQKAANVLKYIDKEPPPESTEALRKKAEAGDGEAAYLLGSRYAFGLSGQAKDEAEGLKWTLMAAGRGQPLAQSNVAIMLINNGKAQEGIMWMTKAAQNGVANSQFELASIYAEGKLVPRDLSKAAEWAKKAAASGDSRAAKLLGQIEGK